MKSMLENAQEEVPAHIWDGVSAGLDKAAKRSAAILWWKRSAIGVAAAAAVTVGVIFGGRSVQTTEPAEELIAVVETSPAAGEEALAAVEGLTPPEQVLMAEVLTPSPTGVVYMPSSAAEAISSLSDSAEEAIEEEEIMENCTQAEKTEVEPIAMLQDDIDWGEDENVAARHRTSLVLSGVTGTSSIPYGAKANIMKRPSLSSGPAQTGITETSTNTTYGIPVSVGAGVKIDLNDKWSLGIGANYSLLSRKFYGTYTKAENGIEVSSTSSDIRNHQHFVGIPLNAYYSLVDNRHINLYTYAGGTVEKCVADEYEVSGTSIIHREKPSGVQLSANIGIGVEFMLGKHLGIYADPSLRYYFDNGQPKSIRTSQPLMLGLDLGLRIKL